MRLRTKLLGSTALLLLLIGLALVGYWRYWPHTPPASQHGSVEQEIAGTTVIVDYIRPVAHGREPFGDIVAWGQLWTPSAERPAFISFSTDVRLNGQPLPKGKYAIWSQPRKDNWTVIFSRDTAADHFSYQEGQDALRLSIGPRSGGHMDTLCFYLPVVDGHAAELVLHWGQVVVPIQITTP